MTNPTTTQELLDWFAVREGWTFRSAIGNHWWEQSEGDPGTDTHPLPATLDTASMLFAKHLPGWTWGKTCNHNPSLYGRWFAYCGAREVIVPDTGDELHDRLALVYAAIQAKEKA